MKYYTVISICSFLITSENFFMFIGHSGFLLVNCLFIPFVHIYVDFGLSFFGGVSLIDLWKEHYL